jgi:hypothetical protein
MSDDLKQLAVMADLYAKNLDYAHKLTDELPAEKWAVQPAPGMNHAAWVIGHLARTSDFAATLIDQQPAVLPENWTTVFGPVSTPSADASIYPDGKALLDALDSAHQRLAGALQKQDLGILDQPPSVERLKSRFPTLRLFVTHVMLTHEMLHLGQLSAWRRVQGLPGVLGRSPAAKS